jgi:predicted small secreted protein
VRVPISFYTRALCRPIAPDGYHRNPSMKNLRPLLMLLIAAAFTVSLSACNTVQGAGKDIKKAGQKIEEAAK